MTQVEVNVKQEQRLEMLLPQLDGDALGARLESEFGTAEQVDIATAWVRASGVRHFKQPLQDVLSRGGTVRVVVGLDADNTSVEGLRELLALKPLTGELSLFVRHNEASPIFHPKVYAFRSDSECRVFVGSSNFTESGLFLNEEANGLLCQPRGGSLETSLDVFMSTLTDTSSDQVRPLTPKFADLLLERRYVKPEASLPGKAANRERRVRKPAERLFGYVPSKRKTPKAPAPRNAPAIEPRNDEPAGDWRRVYLRLRLARGAQAQIPVSVVRALRARLGYAELDGPLDVIVAGGDGRQRISPTYPKRGDGTHPNTYKFETFQPTGNPLLRMDLVGNQITVAKLDSNDEAGRLVEEYILEGLTHDPPQTFRRRKTENATLWRFD